jgi:glycine cleavage system H lipoate-binding protein
MCPHSLKPEKMYKKKIKSVFLVLLGCTVFILAAPENREAGGQDPQKQIPVSSSLTLLSGPETMELGRIWIEEYAREHPGVQINLTSLPAGGAADALKAPLTIGLAGTESLPLIRNEQSRILTLGREILVPVTSVMNPKGTELAHKGIPAGALGSGYVALDDGQLEVTFREGAGAVLDCLKKDPAAIVFCRLTDVADPESGELATGLALVPVDNNGNGTLDSFEEIYDSPASLQRGVWIGKYPRTLMKGLYAVTENPEPGEQELLFLNWLLSEGQDMLASAGYSGITLSEQHSMIERLTGSRNPEPVVSLLPDTGKATWVLPVVLLGLLCLVLLVPLVFRSRFTPAIPGFSGKWNPASGESLAGAPGGLFFDRSHTWVFMERDGKARIGIDHFMQRVTGPLTRLIMKAPGEEIRKGDAFLTLVQEGKKLEIKSPVSGVVLEQNTALGKDASAVHSSPYRDGWVYTVEPADWMKEIRSFFMGDRYAEWIGMEFNRLKAFFSGIVQSRCPIEGAAVLQDGGEPEAGVLGSFGPEVWEEFQDRFINTYAN